MGIKEFDTMQIHAINILLNLDAMKNLPSI